MRDELTNAEHRVLGALAYLANERGTLPSLRELADFLSIYTEETLCRLLDDLRVRGFATDALYGEQSNGDDPVAAERLICSECQDESDEEARGWQALIVSDDDGDPDVIHLCPACAEESCSQTSQHARRRQTYGQDVSRGRRNREGLFSQLADDVPSLGYQNPLSSQQEGAPFFMDLLAAMPTSQSDPEWDWPNLGLLAHSDDEVFFAPAQIPAGPGREQWLSHFMLEAVPSLLAQIERTHIGIVLNLSNTDGREFLVLYATDVREAEVWITEIGRGPDGMRYLVGWENPPEMRTGLWWDYIEACRVTLAEMNAAE